MRQVYPRRILVTSMSQALIAFSLAVSILTFVLSLIEIIPMREGDYARQGSLQFSTFVCLILPFVVAYCAQSKVISAVTQEWVISRACSIKDCAAPTALALQLMNSFSNAAATVGLSCTAEMTKLLCDPLHFIF